MKSKHAKVKPDIEALADLCLNGEIVATVPCCLWLPRHRYERPFFTFRTESRKHEGIGRLSAFFDISITIGKSSENQTKIFAENTHITNFSTIFRSAELPNITTFEGHPEKLTRTRTLNDTRNDKESAYLNFYLSDNFLLSPLKVSTKSYTGDVQVETMDTHAFLIDGIGKVVFDKHFYYLEERNADYSVYSGLVASLTLLESDRLDDGSFSSIVNEIESYLLLASFASNQLTKITNYTIIDASTVTDVWFGNIIVDLPGEKRPHGHHDVLVDISDFEGFIRDSFALFKNFSEQKRNLVSKAIFKLLPHNNSTIESNILNYFSALESIVLIYRRENDLEFTISNNSKWRKLEKALRAAINDKAELFDTESKMTLLKDMLPSLKRISFRHAYEEFEANTGMNSSDLWPLFDTKKIGPSLTEIRNLIVHGSVFESDQITPLVHAMRNMECLAQRAIFIALGWDIGDTNLSIQHLKSYGWIPNKNLIEDLSALAESSPT